MGQLTILLAAASLATLSRGWAFATPRAVLVGEVSVAVVRHYRRLLIIIGVAGRASAAHKQHPSSDAEQRPADAS